MIREGQQLQDLYKEARQQQETTNQVCIWGIEKFFSPKQCLKFFKKSFGENHAITHICKFKNKPFFLVKFETAINCTQFNQKYGKNKRIKVRPIQKETHVEENDYQTVEEVMKPQEKDKTQALQEDLQQVKNTNISDIVEEYHKLPYQEQINLKIQSINKVIENYNTQFFRDAQVKRLHSQGKIIPQMRLDKFIECKQKRQGYRSKAEFTIGQNQNGEPIIGFNKGNYTKKTIMVDTPRNVKIISKKMKFIVSLAESFLKNQGKQLKIFNRFTQQGFWRYLIVRESERTQQTMIIFVCKTKDVLQQQLKKIKDELCSYFKKCVIGLKSLCFLSYDGQADSVPTVSPQVLFGQKYYQERIFQHVFQVSPTAFLQIHIDMCEILYNQIIQAVKQCDVILDLGCGIGTIGISIQKKLPQIKVIGIQICEEAVEDAKKNSETYQVHLGRAQDLIKTICDQHRGKRIVAILDPPRAGFNKQVLIALRRCRGLDNLIYVACNAKAIQDNLLQLTLPVTTKRKAPQFLVKQTVGLDLFPQTSHYQMLYILERT